MNRVWVAMVLSSVAMAAEPETAAETQQEKPAVQNDATPAPGGVRIRLGASLGAGWQIPYPAVALQGEARIGLQFNDIVSAYLTAGGIAGFGLGKNTNSDKLTASLFGQFVSSVLVEAIFGNVFYVAAGPGVGYGAFAASDSTALGPQPVNISARGVKPTFDVRLGFAFGGVDDKTHARHGLNIGLSGLLMFHPNAHLTPFGDSTAGARTALIVTFTPMLMAGYDLR